MRNNNYLFLILLLVVGIVHKGISQNRQCTPACGRDTILSDTAFVIWSPDSSKYLENKQDTAGVYQIYVGYRDSLQPPQCITLKDTTGNYPIASCWWWVRHWYQRNKMQVRWSPSGKYIICVVERECYNELLYTPYSLLLTFLETGWKMDMWATTPDGNHWYQMDSATSSLGNGVVGPVFTPDGKRTAWAQLQDSSKPTDKFGYWNMMLSTYTDTGITGPVFITTTNINPSASRWIEPGNFAADNKSLLISSDIGMTDAEGQDQFILNVNTGAYINLTNSPKIWDEHGVFSPDGKKIIFMSSYPYRSDTNSYHTLGLKTEFMLIDAVYPDTSTTRPSCDSVYYPGLEQLTHFNVPGYPESDTSGAVAAAGGWSPDGTRFYGQDLIAPSYNNWIIVFEGDCGYDSSSVLSINEKQTVGISFNIFPNPVSKMLYVKFPQSIQGLTTIKIIDITGRTIASVNTNVTNEKVVPIDVSGLAQGMYFVNAVSTIAINGVKFIKQ